MTAKTGPLITVRALEPNTGEILMISDKGQTIRLGLKDIPTLGRTTQGVRTMRIGDGDKVASLGLMPEPTVEEDLVEGAQA